MRECGIDSRDLKPVHRRTELTPCLEGHIYTYLLSCALVDENKSSGERNKIILAASAGDARHLYILCWLRCSAPVGRGIARGQLYYTMTRLPRDFLSRDKRIFLYFYPLGFDTHTHTTYILYRVSLSLLRSFIPWETALRAGY